MKKNKKTKTLMSIVKSMLDENGYRYEIDEDVVSLGVSRSNCVVDNKIFVDEDAGLIVVYGLVSLLVKPARRAAVLELMNEKNTRSFFSTLCLNPSDGQVMCRALCYGDKNKLTELEVAAAYAAVVESLDDAFPEIVCASLGIPPELIPSDDDDVAPVNPNGSGDFSRIAPDVYPDLGGATSLRCWTPDKDQESDDSDS